MTPKNHLRQASTKNQSSSIADLETERRRKAESQDKDEARRFLEALDPSAEFYTFQTFDDNKQRRDGSLAKILHGSLDDLWDTLVDLNNRGAGIFATVQATDGKGRKHENITKVRYVFRELDRPNPPPLPCATHILVQSSPGKFHQYVRVEPDETTTVDAFDGVMERLVTDFGSDPNAKDIARVLRVTGFLHQKVAGERFLVHLVEVKDDPPLPWARVVELFPPIARKTRQKIAHATNSFSSRSATTDGLIVNIAEVHQALNAIDPDIGYLDWLRCIMAVHSASQGGREGLDILEEWAKRGALHKPGEIAYRYSTLDVCPPREAVHVRTLFHIASRYGWYDLKWSDGDEQTERLIWEQRKRQMAEFDKYHGLLMIDSKAVIVFRQYDDALKRRTTVFSDVDNVNHYHANVKVPSIVTGGNGARRLNTTPIVKAWEASRDRRTFRRPTFRPTAGLIASQDMRLPDERDYNLFQGWTIEPRKGDCSPILAHIKDIWCAGNEENYEYVTKWLASTIQEPNQQGHTAIVLKSGQGTGKNIITDWFVRLFGINGITLNDPNQLTGEFNDDLASCVFAVLNEAVWGGNKKSEGQVKAYITDDVLPVNRKFVPRFTVPNRCHFAVNTNSDFAVPVGLDDRRFFMLEVSHARQRDYDYFQRVQACLMGEGGPAFLHHLVEAVDLSRFNVRDMPQGDIAMKLEHKEQSAHSTEEWILECLQEGAIVHRDRAFNVTRDLAEEWLLKPLEIPKKDIHEAYAAWCSLRGIKVSALKSLTQALRKLTGAENTRAGLGDRARIYRIPPLPLAFQHAQDHLKQQIPHDHDFMSYYLS